MLTRMLRRLTLEAAGVAAAVADSLADGVRDLADDHAFRWLMRRQDFDRRRGRALLERLAGQLGARVEMSSPLEPAPELGNEPAAADA